MTDDTEPHKDASARLDTDAILVREALHAADSASNAADTSARAATYSAAAAVILAILTAVQVAVSLADRDRTIVIVAKEPVTLTSRAQP
jgi:hypothetical protein